jgi:magnesium transporter
MLPGAKQPKKAPRPTPRTLASLAFLADLPALCPLRQIRAARARGMMETRNIGPVELREAWWLLAPEDRIEGFRLLEADDAEEFFFDLSAADQADLILSLRPAERRLWLRLLPPDDAADLVQEADEAQRDSLLNLLDESSRREVTALLAYEEDEAGGLMSSRFARVRADMRVDEAISYLRKQAISTVELETIYYVYVLDSQQRLLGISSFRELFASPGDRSIRDVMTTEVLTAHEEMDQEALARLFAEHDLLAMPIVDDEGRMKGIVTVDDIVDVVEEEATEDIQKYGGMAALEEPYLRIGLGDLLRKRAGWLSLLFVGGLFTTLAMQNYQDRLTAAGLVIFLPLIISSGGNSGSQASTLVIRAMTLGEVRLRDWWRVARRELISGLMLGLVLGLLAVVRVGAGNLFGFEPQDHAGRFAATISISLVAVVVLGTLAGSMLPLALKRLGLDPASASAPLVATLVDVAGIILYMTVASLLLF